MQFSEMFAKNKKIKNVMQAVQRKENVMVSGLNDSRLSFFLSGIYSRLRQTLVVITYDKNQYVNLHEDLLRLINEENILLFPGYEVLPHEQLEPNVSVMRDRINCLHRLQFLKKPVVVITYGPALLRGLIPATNFKKQSLCLKIGDIINREQLTAKLSTSGYKRVEMVDSIRQFSVRGGIVDIFSTVSGKPVRIELFG
ncbi:MAG: hypothetical protein ACOC5A_07070, partial [Halanaerobiales bacterium]